MSEATDALNAYWLAASEQERIDFVLDHQPEIEGFLGLDEPATLPADFWERDEPSLIERASMICRAALLTGMLVIPGIAAALSGCAPSVMDHIRQQDSLTSQNLQEACKGNPDPSYCYQTGMDTQYKDDLILIKGIQADNQEAREQRAIDDLDSISHSLAR